MDFVEGAGETNLSRASCSYGVGVAAGVRQTPLV